MRGSSSNTTPERSVLGNQWRDSFNEFKSRLPANVVVGDEARFALVPENEDQIPVILQIANILKEAGKLPASLVPQSAGKNWGTDIKHGHDKAGMTSQLGIPLNLCNLNQMDLDSDGNIRIGAGVTQEQFQQFLTTQAGTRKIANISSAGPKTSVLGNALERGFGSFPITKHFNALTALMFYPGHGQERNRIEFMKAQMLEVMRQMEAYPAGHPERERLSALCDHLQMTNLIAGSFYRGHAGVVSEATMRLVDRPLFFAKLNFDVKPGVDNQTLLRKFQELYREFMLDFYEPSSCINVFMLSNQARQLPMHMNFPSKREGVSLDRPLPPDILKALAREKGIAQWSGRVSLSAPDMQTAAHLLERMKKEIGDLCENARMVYSINQNLSGRDIEKTSYRLSRIVPEWTSSHLDPLLLDKPNESGLAVAYWRSKEGAPAKDLDPGRDKCGLRWGKFIGPTDNAMAMADIVARTYYEYGFDPMVRMRSDSLDHTYCLSPMTFVNTPEARERSKECYRTLFNKLRSIGYHPQGLPYDMMRLHEQQNEVMETLEETHIERINNPFMMTPFPHPFQQDQAIHINGARLAGIIRARNIMRELDPNQVLQAFPTIW